MDKELVQATDAVLAAEAHLLAVQQELEALDVAREVARARHEAAVRNRDEAVAILRTATVSLAGVNIIADKASAA